MSAVEAEYKMQLQNSRKIKQILITMWVKKFLKIINLMSC